MRKFAQGQAVKYVTATGEIVDGTIEESSSLGVAMIRHGAKELALARYFEGKEPNTFYLEDSEPDDPQPEPFKPGAGQPDKPQKPGADAPAP